MEVTRVPGSDMTLWKQESPPKLRSNLRGEDVKWGSEHIRGLVLLWLFQVVLATIAWRIALLSLCSQVRGILPAWRFSNFWDWLDDYFSDC